MNRFIFITVALLSSICFGQTTAGGPRVYRPTALTGQSIAAAIARAQADGARVYIPGGVYSVTQTIDLSNLQPMRIEGEAPSFGPQWTGKGSVTLKWAGPAGGTMIRLHGQATQIDGLSVDGNGTAGIGINIVNRDGAGTSMERLSNVYIGHIAGPCIQAGQTPNDQNAADVFFERVFFDASQAGFRVVHSQGLNYQFDGCEWSNLAVALDIQHGGAVYVRGGGGCNVGAFIKPGDLGPNTGVISVRDLRLEDGASPMIVVDSGGSNGRIIIDGLYIASASQAQGTSRIRIGANTTLNIRDSLIPPPHGAPWGIVEGLPTWPEAPAILSIENVSGFDPASIKKNDQAIVNVR
jgi:hypothetical protein